MYFQIWIVSLSVLLCISDEQVNAVDANNDYDSKTISIWDLFMRRTKRPSRTTTTAPTTQKCSKCSCGLPNGKNRIVGGHDTQENQYPWVVMLRFENQFYCGGSLINDQYILTAAHCVDGIPHNGISIRFLSYSRVVSSSQTFDRKAAKIISHPSYNRATFNNDIALIKLDERVQLNGITLRPVCLPTSSDNYAGEKGIVTGWGTIREGGPLANNLQEVELPITSNQECKSKISITANMICAGEKAGNKDSCQGDSGGPLHVIKLNKFYEVGIVSYGEGCARPNKYGVYTRVSNYNTWIKTNTRESCYCS